MSETVNQIPILTDSDLPALFNAADKAAIDKKRKYLIFTACDLIFLVAGISLLSIEYYAETLRPITGFAAAIVFTLSFVITIILLKAQHEKIWYGARAVAETVKSLSWKYITCAEPFTSKLTALDADEELIAKLIKTIEEKKEIFWSFNGDLAANSEIPDTLRKLRSQDLETRKQVYLEQRILNQRKWYGQNSQNNRAGAIRLLYVVLFAQLLAILSAFAFVPYPTIHINSAHIFSAIAIAVLAWVQVKQHQELAQAYAIAAHELGLIAEQISHVKTDEMFSKFVCETENAISREHTMWIAKRERLI
jgi:hypothetical protein